MLRQTAGAGEQLDRSAAVLGEALLDLLRLLVGMGVQRKVVLHRIASDLLEPVGRAGPNRVGCETDGDPSGPQLLDLLEILGHGGLSEAGETTARVGDVEEDDRDSSGVCGLRGSVGLGDTQVVELADGRVSRSEHLAVCELVLRTHQHGRLPVGSGEHRLPPGPEVVSRSAPSERPLERVAMGVHEAGESQPARHGATLAGSAMRYRRSVPPCPGRSFAARFRTR